MRRTLLTILFLVGPLFSFSQKTIEKTIERFNKGTVPYIRVEELKHRNQFTLLDTRKKDEYAVSRIKNAQWVGHKRVDIKKVFETIPDKSTPIVVYCSVGVRSEDIGEKLVNAGYTDVKNLYGGIFEWKNQGNVVVDSTGNTTEKVHAFSKHWGKLLTNAEKVYHYKSPTH